MNLTQAIEEMEAGRRIQRPGWKRIKYIYFNGSKYYYRLKDDREFPLHFFHYDWHNRTDFQVV